jgi:hypothetical protein
MNLNDELIASRYHQAHFAIAHILSGLDPPPPATYEDALRQNGRLIAAGVPLLQLAGVLFAAWRFRRWRRRPPDTGSTRWRLYNLVLPLVTDVGVPLYLWSVFLGESEGPFDMRRTFTFAPDFGVALVVMTALGFGWAIVRTILTLRLMRASRPNGVAPGSDPIASPA